MTNGIQIEEEMHSLSFIHQVTPYVRESTKGGETKGIVIHLTRIPVQKEKTGLQEQGDVTIAQIEKGRGKSHKAKHRRQRRNLRHRNSKEHNIVGTAIGRDGAIIKEYVKEV